MERIRAKQAKTDKSSHGVMRMKIQKLICAVFILALLLCPTACSAASGFLGYEGSLLKIDDPRKLRIYQPGSRTNYRMVHVTRPSLTITDARWQGDSLAVYVKDPSGASMILLYSSFTNYRVVK